ncbi:MAG: DUF1295 domain-containing protein [Bacteroidales bacterium]|nr:DUF1295 domain-containing protein [Bacteroidales bacterium]
MELFDPHLYWSLLVAVAILSLPVFICLQWINAGYGVMYTPKWGPAISNRIGWIAMELPALLCFVGVWAAALYHKLPGATEPWPLVIGALFALHYIHRSLIFPLLMRGRSKMPLTIIAMGVIFNALNAYLIAGWLFAIVPTGYYDGWARTPMFWIGLCVFITGAAINMHSDNIIRHLRAPGDRGHYIPRGGMFRYVTSANYFGEFTEWVGYAILSWSWAGAVFALWTFANLAPRASALHRRYLSEFGDQYARLHRKRILPYIY